MFQNLMGVMAGVGCMIICWTGVLTMASKVGMMPTWVYAHPLVTLMVSSAIILLGNKGLSIVSLWNSGGAIGIVVGGILLPLMVAVYVQELKLDWAIFASAGVVLGGAVWLFFAMQRAMPTA